MTHKPSLRKHERFGTYVDVGDRARGATMVVAVNRGGGREATGFVCLPHQLYTKKLKALLGDGTRTIEVIPVNYLDWIDVTDLVKEAPDE